MRAFLHTIVAGGLLIVFTASGADGACITPSSRPATASNPVARGLLPNVLAASPAVTATTDASESSIVGLWFTTFYVGDGPGVWDEAYEQWHSDGTELALDNAVPPSLGNVCVGVWKQEGRTIRLRHFTFNWNPDGTKAGTFTLLMTATVGHGGKSLSGRYVSDSYDLEGNVIPELHGEGVVRATRITAD